MKEQCKKLETMHKETEELFVPQASAYYLQKKPTFTDAFAQEAKRVAVLGGIKKKLRDSIVMNRAAAGLSEKDVESLIESEVTSSERDFANFKKEDIHLFRKTSHERITSRISSTVAKRMDHKGLKRLFRPVNSDESSPLLKDRPTRRLTEHAFKL